MRTWRLREAKSRLSEVIEAAVTSGPQLIIDRDVETAVVLSYTEYQRLVAHRGKLSAFFRTSPLAGVPLDLRRDQT
jgi:prevent-host-death family protein